MPDGGSIVLIGSALGLKGVELTPRRAGRGAGAVQRGVRATLDVAAAVDDEEQPRWMERELSVLVLHEGRACAFTAATISGSVSVSRPRSIRAAVDPTTSIGCHDRMQSNELLAVDASWTRGANTQKGKLLIRPQLAVFAPTEEKVNALAVAGVGLGLAFAGFSLRVVPGQYRDVASYVGALMQLPAAEFDAHLWPAARAAGWWIATPADSALLFKKTPLFDRFKCWVKRGNDNVGAVFGIPGAIARAAEPMLTAWPRA